ncbi:MAG: hypothetical protein R8N23_10265 [Reichenbachiella sp.]|uniref:hypothetical protein n=1 Tax=Reichenbachiella sp. TaxID=2184521 RepID=UPI00296779BC|nr:hypothetical protein [Reichenbachiella sp.]MDW3210243.1 hypothetical protein [Reichenbachiella sp.]
MANSTTKKHFIDGILIVFSVLFALFINKTAENYKITQEKEIAIESIHKELYRNYWNIKSWNKDHLAVINRLDSLTNGLKPELEQELKQADFFDLSPLLDKSGLINSMLISSAWETSKETGIFSEFDYEILQSITRTYDFQKALTDNTVPKIMDTYFSKDSHRMDEIDLTIMVFYLQMSQLCGHELVLISLYEESINTIKEKTHLKTKVYVDSLRHYVDK